MIHSECLVLDLASHSNDVELVTPQGSIRSFFIVAADGAMSVVARKAGWAQASRRMPALEWEVRVSDDVMERFSQVARFDFGLVPSGYAWVFPKKRHLSDGLLTTRKGPADLKGCLKRYLEFLGINEIEALDQHGFVIPSGARKTSAKESAPHWRRRRSGRPGDGRRHQFCHPQRTTCSQDLVDCDLKEHRVEEFYNRRLSREILSELRPARLLAKLLYDYPGARGSLFKHYGQRLCEAMTDVFMGTRSYQEIVHNPLDYLKLMGFKKS